jgi:hypothetical protein
MRPANGYTQLLGLLHMFARQRGNNRHNGPDPSSACGAGLEPASLCVFHDGQVENLPHDGVWNRHRCQSAVMSRSLQNANYSLQIADPVNMHFLPI